MYIGNARPDILDEVGQAIDIGNSGEKPQIYQGSAVGCRVGWAGLVDVDVGGVGNDDRVGGGDLIAHTPLVRFAAEIHAVSVTVSLQLFPSQLAPIDPGIGTARQAAADAGELPGQVVGNFVRVDEE